MKGCGDELSLGKIKRKLAFMHPLLEGEESFKIHLPLGSAVDVVPSC
jgi:hypothetical protein